MEVEVVCSILEVIWTKGRYRAALAARGEQSIETIASLVQWSMTIKNHGNQWFNDPKTIEKPLKAMVLGL